MLILSIAITALALTMLAVGLAGRRSPRGQYCRRCRFDLGGLDLDAHEPRCPECGAGVAQDAARRAVVRLRRRAPIWAGSLSLVLGAVLLAFSLIGGAGTIYAKLPTNSILMLTEWGDDESLDETIRRLGLPGYQLTESQWDRLIVKGLAIQANESIEWDWRWGEVLSVALLSNEMSREEIGQYFLNGLAPEISARTRIHTGGYGIQNRLDITQNRMWAMKNKATDFVVTCHFVAFGAVGKEPIQQSEPSTFSRAFSISATPHQGTGASYGGVRGIHHRIDRAPGETARVYFDYIIRVRRMEAEEPIVDTVIRKEFEVEFVDPSVPLVEPVRDDVINRALQKEVLCSSIQVPTEFPELNQFGMYNVISGMMTVPMMSEILALRIYVELDDDEIEVGKIFTDPSSPSGSFGGPMRARASPRNETDVERLRSLHLRLIEKSHVRVIVRSDPKLAAQKPEGDRILGVEIVFEHIPVVLETDIPAYISHIPDGMLIHNPTSVEPFGLDDGTERDEP